MTEKQLKEFLKSMERVREVHATTPSGRLTVSISPKALTWLHELSSSFILAYHGCDCSVAKRTSCLSRISVLRLASLECSRAHKTWMLQSGGESPWAETKVSYASGPI
jgi:hypothetical protein